MLEILDRKSIWFDMMHPSLENISYYARFFFNKTYARLLNKRDYSSAILDWTRVYYRYHASGKHPDWWDANLTKGRYSKEMKQVLDILSRDFNEDLKLIDVGSGPVTSFFEYLDITAWKIITVDPLAKLYNYLNKKYRINYPHKCIEGTGECLDELFDQNSFHLVISQNAMDHAISPQEFINKLYYVLKPGGFMYLSGFVNVGTREKWTGLHQHNLYVVGDHLFWTNRDKSINNLNITKNLNITLFYKNVEGPNPGDFFTLIYRKNEIHKSV